ncbi:MAG: patatin family protein [Muribaculum sp.]|nr:patatin family protein [Muribaculum sp.]
MSNKIKTGLVLEGGGMRGLFTAGVIDVLMENGITFDGLIGVSAGSSFGCNYKSNQPGRVLRDSLKFRNDPRYMGIMSFILTGNIIGAKFAYHTMPDRLDIFDRNAFKRNPMEFYVVCTDTQTGEPVYHKIDTVDYQALEWLRASASMPILSRPVKVSDGRLMLDGGISDSIPLKYFQNNEYKRNIVVLTQPRNYQKTKSPGWIFKILMPYAPKIAEAMSRRHIMYNSQLEYINQQEQHGNTLIIAPEETLPIGRLEMKADKIKQVYNLGRETATSQLPLILKFLNNKNVI